MNRVTQGSKAENFCLVDMMVARDRIELPTRGFSGGTINLRSINNQSLTALAHSLMRLKAGNQRSITPRLCTILAQNTLLHITAIEGLT